MRLVARSKSDQNEAAIDPWTVVHLAAGLAAGLVGISFTKSMIAAAAYEFFEHGAEKTEWGQKLFKTEGPENIPNMIADLVVFGIGQQLGEYWNKT